MNADELILGFNADAPDYDRNTWADMAKHLLSRLSTALGHQLSPDTNEETWSLGNGMCVDFRSKVIGTALGGFGIRGILGAQVAEDGLLVRAWVFVYLGGVRLAATGRGDVLAMRYVRNDEVGEWEGWGHGGDASGWHFGEPGEFDAFERFHEGGESSGTSGS